jgi:Cys-tRNA(Pro)/Cys-tRNA(Cys) deacylase
VGKATRAKTNAMRALDARAVMYDTFTYPSSVHSATDVATLLGVPAAEVYKTLVLLAEDGRSLLVMAPGDAEVNLRLLARSLGVKSVRMAAQREAERLTGLLVGGISPLALLGRPFAVYLDRSAEAHDWLYLNGGQRGINLRIRVADLLAVTGAALVEATQPPTGVL